MPPSEVVSLCLFTKHTWLGTGRWTCHWKLPQQVALTVLKAQVKAIVRVLIATLSVDRTTYWRVVHKSLSWRTSLDLFIWPDLALHNHSQLPMTGYQRRRPQSSSWWEETNLDSPPDKCFFIEKQLDHTKGCSTMNIASQWCGFSFNPCQVYALSLHLGQILIHLRLVSTMWKINWTTKYFIL